jgi:hypothetical protein
MSDLPVEGGWLRQFFSGARVHEKPGGDAMFVCGYQTTVDYDEVAVLVALLNQ